MDETSVLTVGDSSLADGWETCACTLQNATSTAAQKNKLLFRTMLVQKYMLQYSQAVSSRF